MKRYHIKVNFPVEDKDTLTLFTEVLNNRNLSYSPHCLDNLKHRAIDLEGVLLYIKNSLRFDSKDIFEYYKSEGGFIEKVCYRVNYRANIDLILVISKDRKIITIYFNNREDRHETLNKNIYEQPLTLAV